MRSDINFQIGRIDTLSNQQKLDDARLKALKAQMVDMDQRINHLTVSLNSAIALIDEFKKEIEKLTLTNETPKIKIRKRRARKAYAKTNQGEQQEGRVSGPVNSVDGDSR